VARASKLSFRTPQSNVATASLMDMASVFG